MFVAFFLEKPYENSTEENQQTPASWASCVTSFRFRTVHGKGFAKQNEPSRFSDLLGVSLNGGTQQPWGFPTKNDHFEVFWGCHHLRKHPFSLGHPFD